MSDQEKTERLAFVKKAASQLPSGDDELLDAFDDAECALEDDAPDANEKFMHFSALLNDRGITIKDRKPAYTPQEEKWLQTPRPNRGKLYGF